MKTVTASLLTLLAVLTFSQVFAADIDALYESYWKALEMETGAAVPRPVLDPLTDADLASLTGDWKFVAYPGTPLEEKCSIAVASDKTFKATAGGADRTGKMEIGNNKVILLLSDSGEFWTCIIRVGGKWSILYASSDKGMLELTK